MSIDTARKLIETIKTDLAEIDGRIRNHEFITTLEEGKIPREALKNFAGHQHYINGSDLRSIALLISRQGSETGRKYHTDLLLGKTAAAEALLEFAAALDLDEDWLNSYEPHPGGAAYTSYVAWLAANGTDAELAAGYLVNLPAWGANCGRMSHALKRRYGFESGDLTFFTLFACPPPSFEKESLDVVADGLARGVEPKRIARAARLLQGYELMYWDTMSGL